MYNSIKTIMQGTLDALFPPLCYSCRAYLKKEEKKLSVCAKCASSIQVWNGLFCPVCKSRIPIRNYKLSESTNTVFVDSGHSGFWVGLPACHPDAPFLLAACSDYGNPAVKELLHTFKYKKIENAIRPITELLIKPYVKRVFLKSDLPNIACPREGFRESERGGRTSIIIPIPLHKTKLRARGFNQSELIAHAFQQSLAVRQPEIRKSDVPNIEKMYSSKSGYRISAGYPISKILIRVKQTDPQAETKNAKERKENVRDCFSLNPKSYVLSPMSSVILVDDVYTSGATMEEAVRVLKEAGAKHILTFVLAKT